MASFELAIFVKKSFFSNALILRQQSMIYKHFKFKIMKTYLLILIVIISFKSLNAQIALAPVMEKPSKENREPLKTSLTKSSILSYIKLIERDNKSFGKAFIQKIEENMDYDKMYLERRYSDQIFVIIPLKKVYFSQHAINKKYSPIQYVVVVENEKDKGKVSRVDLLLIFPKDKSITSLPKNAFFDFASQNLTQVDATYTYVNFGDVKQFELTIENGKRVSDITWSFKENNGDNCRLWTMDFFDYNKTGAKAFVKKDLGKTCTNCPPGFVCDPLK
jgi:hypothetical protein